MRFGSFVHISKTSNPLGIFRGFRTFAKAAIRKPKPVVLQLHYPVNPGESYANLPREASSGALIPSAGIVSAPLYVLQRQAAELVRVPTPTARGPSRIVADGHSAILDDELGVRSGQAKKSLDQHSRAERK